MDASVGTEMGTMTEPDCLGPLDPGTSVTLEGIVWHETDGGEFHQIFIGSFKEILVGCRFSVGLCNLTISHYLRILISFIFEKSN